MSLEGLRAWIGEVERKLGKRTRVFLALAVIAIGLGGAAIYLAIDAREDSVSERDVQELQRELEAQIDAAVTGQGAAATEPVEPTEPEPAPEPKSDGSEGDGTGGIGAGGSSSGDAGGTTGGSADSDKAGGARIQKLLEQAEEQNAEAEEDSDGK